MGTDPLGADQGVYREVRDMSKEDLGLSGEQISDAIREADEEASKEDSQKEPFPAWFCQWGYRGV